MPKVRQSWAVRVVMSFRVSLCTSLASTGSNSVKFDIWKSINTWGVQVLRSPEEAFAAAMQSGVRVVKNVCLQGDYVEK